MLTNIIKEKVKTQEKLNKQTKTQINPTKDKEDLKGSRGNVQEFKKVVIKFCPHLLG